MRICAKNYEFRRYIFKKLLDISEKYTPSIFIRFELQILMNVTSNAFGTVRKCIWHLPLEKALKEYVVFTKNCMQTKNSAPKMLYRKAFILGKTLLWITGFTEETDKRRLLIFLYRNIKITMNFVDAEKITFPSCYFSRYYTPEQCKFMSNFDSGIISGICGKGRLKFTGRITEGCEKCTAYLGRK